MFSIAQIAAIIGLLVAFGAPQASIDTVQTILTSNQAPTEDSGSSQNLGGSTPAPAPAPKHPTSVQDITVNSTLDVAAGTISVDVFQVPEDYPITISIQPLRQPGTELAVGDMQKECNQRYVDGIARCRYSATYSNIPVTSKSKPSDFVMDITFNGKTIDGTVGWDGQWFSYKDLSF